MGGGGGGGGGYSPSQPSSPCVCVPCCISEIYFAYRNMYYADYSNTSSARVMKVKEFFESQVGSIWM